MKATELRIGNWVDYTCKLSDRYIQAIGKNEMICLLNNLAKAEPIPLTEEWLEAFGFQKVGAWFYKGDFALRPKSEFIGLEYGGFILSILDIHIDYVHTLQNLYFPLTGEELEKK